jgi:hypothetical protein
MKYSVQKKITLKEAREILGEDGSSLSDEELSIIINKLYDIAEIYIKSVPKL